MQCLDDNAVSEFVSGALPPSLLTRVEGHLAGCRDCRALVAAMAQDAMADSNVKTVKHERLTASQVAELPKRTLSVGDRVGRYLVLSTLGTGGMGVVFAAYDPQLDRKVALKLLRSGIQLATKDARKRLQREAQAIAQLSHPNVVGVYDVGTTDDGDLYIAMEFVEGDTLTTWLKRWPRTWREIIDVFLQAARGLVAAHSVGLLHRDFKPDNVLVGGDGRVRVTDFGLARSLIAHLDEESGRGVTPQMPTALNSQLTATGTVLGTPRYMPPEQLTGPDIDARSDQFSFCVALHEALYGEHPLPGSTSVSMLENGDKALPPPENTRVPANINRAVARGLERDRAKRWPTMAQLMGELVPPAPRISARTVAFALGGLLLVTGAAAAVVAQKDPTPENLPPDDRDLLFQEINALKVQINQIEKERRILFDELQKRSVDLPRLEKELTAKDEQIQNLLRKVTELEAKKPEAVVSPPTKRPSQEFQVNQTLINSEGIFDGCFAEWAERRDDLGNMHREANMLVRLTVNPEGISHSATASGESSPSLRLCLELAVVRIRFPSGPEQLDVEVQVGWAEGVLNLSPRIVGRREAPRSNIDLR
ncbi:MAG: protein kinase [Deltaproteobacteria bacterium]|nr:protein kinase [Deltaproteobacteria bacterium]